MGCRVASLRLSPRNDDGYVDRFYAAAAEKRQCDPSDLDEVQTPFDAVQAHIDAIQSCTDSRKVSLKRG